MNTVKERLVFAMERAGMSQSELARVVGNKPQSVQYLCSGGGDGTRSRYIMEIAVSLNVRPEWLLVGEEPMEVDGTIGLSRSPIEDRVASSPKAIQRLVETILEMSESGALSEAAGDALLRFLEALPTKQTPMGTFERLRRRARDVGRTAQ
jgi:transcriptional regulator with XRE-family HTH domain